MFIRKREEGKAYEIRSRFLRLKNGIKTKKNMEGGKVKQGE